MLDTFVGVDHFFRLFFFFQSYTLYLIKIYRNNFGIGIFFFLEGNYIMLQNVHFHALIIRVLEFSGNQVQAILGPSNLSVSLVIQC